MKGMREVKSGRREKRVFFGQVFFENESDFVGMKEFEGKFR